MDGFNRPAVSNPLAEQSVVGVILMNGEKCGDAFGILTQEMFANDLLGEIYASAYESYCTSQNIDVVTVTAGLGEDAKQLAVECAAIAPSLSRATDYAEIVREEWRVRDIQSRLFEIALQAGPGVLAKDMVAETSAVVDAQLALENSIVDGNARIFRDCVKEYLTALQRPPDSIKTGFKLLDYITGGFRRKGVYVISARPGMGKTDFALNLALRMSRSFRVNYNSLEMPREQCTEWCLSNLTRIDHTKMRDRTLSQEDYDAIARASEMMYSAPLVIDEQERITAAEVKSRILKHHPDVVFIDNLQLMGVMSKKNNQWEQLAETTGMLKSIAMKHNIVIVLLVQEKREGDRNNEPVMGDTKGSGQTEADADAVMFLKNDRGKRFLRGDEYCTARLHIVKNRHGGTGVCEFFWQPQYKSFAEVERGHEA